MANQYIGKTLVPQDLYDAARTVKTKGGKAFLAFPEFDTGNCTNCGGSGNIVFQVVSGGPYKSPGESRNKQDECVISEGGKWFDVRTKVYTCPVCRPSSGQSANGQHRIKSASYS